MPEAPPYPETAAARDLWIRQRRHGIPRDVLSSTHAGGWLAESEPTAAGRSESGLTVFLTNRECPWRCLMCDLWRHTLEESVPVGAIPHQLADALDAAGPDPDRQWIKLYNAGSFFDPAAIPTADHPEIARLCAPFRRVVVECHPALVGHRVNDFRDLLKAGSQLEVALGLETAHPEVLEKLNKRVTRDGFARAVRWLKEHGCAVRAFVLVKPPFLDEAAAREWGCRSIDFAFDCGVDIVSLIPTRSGNGALEALAASGDFSPPSLATFEAVFVHGLRQRRGVVLADLWDLGRLVTDPGELDAVRTRLETWNRCQSAECGPATR